MKSLALKALLKTYEYTFLNAHGKEVKKEFPTITTGTRMETFVLAS
jgi:hypothetical protein